MSIHLSAHRHAIWKLASLLRIADALDRGHYNALELWAARLKSNMFTTTFHRPLHFTATIQKSRHGARQ